MKRFVLLVVVFLFNLFCASAQRDSLLVMFWNLENFFDWTDGGQSPSDREFSYDGARRWTPRRFYAKCNSVAKTILWTADMKARLPDIVGVAEVENADVLRRLCNYTSLYKYGYACVHYDSPDPRGIDVGLLYRKDALTLLSSRPVHIAEFATRDILEAEFLTQGGDTVHISVNHHPSKYGGTATGGRRITAMQCLAQLCDSVRRAGCTNIVAVGDFNDTPDAEAFRILEPDMTNLALPLHRAGEGSIRFDGKWELIDMIMVSSQMPHTEMEILRPPLLMTADKSHSGLKPLRTYSGPRWIGGVSDHLPVMSWIYLK